MVITMDSNWDASLQTLKGVGVKRAQLFEKLGVHSVGALLRYYPRAYEDWSVVTPLGRALWARPPACGRPVLRPVKEHYIRKGMVLYKTQAADGPVRLDLTFFNNRFVLDSLRAGEEYLFYGKVEGNLVGRSMVSPAFASAASPPGLRPIYRQTEGLPSRAIAAAVKQALDRVDDIIGDPLPEELCKQHGLCHLRFCSAKHPLSPPPPDALAIARRRLVFEELLTLQLGLQRLKGREKEGCAPVMAHDYTGEFFSMLPFSPTGAQRRAAADCVADLRRSAPMSRLLQGDVGSAKPP